MMEPKKGDKVEVRRTAFVVTSVQHDVERVEPFRERVGKHPETGEPEPYLRVRLQLQDDTWDAFQEDGVVDDPPKAELVASRSTFEQMSEDDFADVVNAQVYPDLIEAVGKGLRVIWGEGENDPEASEPPASEHRGCCGDECREQAEEMRINGEPVAVDWCIAPLVRALNEAGHRTVASCCGHGHRPGTIVLADERELLVARDHEMARSVDKLFPDIHGEWGHVVSRMVGTPCTRVLEGSALAETCSEPSVAVVDVGGAEEPLCAHHAREALSDL